MKTYLEEYTRRFKERLSEIDGSIQIESFENIVKQVNRFKNAIERDPPSPIISDLYEAIAMVDMEGRRMHVFSFDKTMLVIFESTKEYHVRGLTMKFSERECDTIKCCRAPPRDHIELITDEEEAKEAISTKDQYVYKLPAVIGRAYFLFFAVDRPPLECIFLTFIISDDHKEEKEEYVELKTNKEYSSDEVTVTEQQTQATQKKNVQQILDDLEMMLQNDSSLISLQEVHQAVDQIDNLLEEGNDEVIPGQLLHILDELGARMDLKGNQTGIAVGDNFALLAADSEPSNPVRGFRLPAGDNSVFSDAFQFIKEKEYRVPLSSDTDALVFLPDSVTHSSRRISFVIFKNDRAFHDEQYCRINSKILSINVENMTSLDNGEMVDLFLSPLTVDLQRDEELVCAYWHFHSNGSGHWSQDGCFFVRASQDGELDACRCNHLTHFAQILIKKEVFSEMHENILEIISVMGCSFSLLGIIIVALTAMLFKSWRRNVSNQIWLQLCAAVFVLDICFIVIVFVRFNAYDIGCLLVGIALHYSVLATFSWMTVVSILSYRKLVLVFAREIPKKVLIASCFSWGTPWLVIGILLAVDSNSYSRKFEEKSPSGSFCYPSGLALWLAVYVPITVMWLVNWMLYALITKSLYVDKKIRRHSSATDTLQSASTSCLLAFLCGIPWAFGFFSYNIVAAYLFTLTVSFQGFVLFLFFVLGTTRTRELWVNMLRSKFRCIRTGNTLDYSSSRSVEKARFYVPKPLTSADEHSSELPSEGIELCAK